MKPGATLIGGDIIGNVFENNLLNEHRILVPPKSKGRVVSVVPPGNYTIKDTLVELEYDGKIHPICMSHFWPVR